LYLITQTQIELVVVGNHFHSKKINPNLPKEKE
jgi:hypothetical protein